MARRENQTSGKVFLVGAGPGDPGLITLRGIACLRQAELILYDYLVNPVILQHAPPSAEAVCLGHHATKTVSQTEINARMVAGAKQGKTVVRLKGGDPIIFGRSGEEIEALQAAGLAYEVVPGVTAALAAAAYAGIPVTHADCSSAVALVTGHERQCKKAPPLSFAALADFPGTLVFYMGVTSAPNWSQALIGRGRSPETPVAIVRRCTWPDQAVTRCTLGTIAAVIAEQRLGPPAVCIVGPAASLAPELSWFAGRPLFGIRILVTRPRHQATALADRLTEQGADVLFQPAIAIGPPADWAPVDHAIDRLRDFHWVAFSSSNGVSFFLDRLEQTGRDLRRLGGVRLAAIGPGTADELARYRLRADLVPAEFRAESLAEALAAEAAGRRFLLIRASRGREVLADQLVAAGGVVEQVVAYQSTDVEQPDAEISAALAEGRIDWITVTSSAIARSLVRLFGEDLRRAKLASISPVTSGVLRTLGHEPAAEAKVYTMDGLADAITAVVPAR